MGFEETIEKHPVESATVAVGVTHAVAIATGSSVASVTGSVISAAGAYGGAAAGLSQILVAAAATAPIWGPFAVVAGIGYGVYKLGKALSD